MALATKIQLPDSLISEQTEYERLYRLGTSRTTSGNVTFTSTTSGTAYNINGTDYQNMGQKGMMDYLFNENPRLSQYSFTITDYNNISTELNKSFLERMSVGDTFSTARVSLNENWALCDGSIFNTSDTDTFENYFSGRIPNNLRASTEVSTTHDLKDSFHNGSYWAMISDRTSSNHIYSISGNVPHGTWNSRSIGSPLESIYYHGGYWVVVGDGGALYYNNNVNPNNNSWVQNDQGSADFKKVYHNGNYWIAIGTTGHLYYKSGNNPSGSWNSNNLGTGTLSDIHYNGTYMVMASSNGIYYTEGNNPNSSWTLKSSVGDEPFYSVHHSGTHWAISGDTGSISYIAGNDPSGDWTSLKIINTNDDLYGIYYANGYWVVAGRNGVAYYIKNQNPNGIWKNVSPSEHFGTHNYYSVHYNGSHWLLTAASGRVAYSDNFLPEINLATGINTFIKIK